MEDVQKVCGGTTEDVLATLARLQARALAVQYGARRDRWARQTWREHVHTDDPVRIAEYAMSFCTECPSELQERLASIGAAGGGPEGYMTEDVQRFCGGTMEDVRAALLRARARGMVRQNPDGRWVQCYRDKEYELASRRNVTDATKDEDAGGAWRAEQTRRKKVERIRRQQLALQVDPSKRHFPCPYCNVLCEHTNNSCSGCGHPW